MTLGSGFLLYLKKHKKKVQEEDNEEEKEVLLVTIWPEPCCYAKTPEEKKQRMEFDFSADGVMEAADWLNEQYIQQKPLWDLSKKLV